MKFGTLIDLYKGFGIGRDMDMRHVLFPRHEQCVHAFVACPAQVFVLPISTTNYMIHLLSSPKGFTQRQYDILHDRTAQAMVNGPPAAGRHCLGGLRSAPREPALHPPGSPSVRRSHPDRSIPTWRHGIGCSCSAVRPCAWLPRPLPWQRAENRQTHRRTLDNQRIRLAGGAYCRCAFTAHT